MGSDAELRAARRDPEAFARFYRMHARDVYAWFDRRLGDAELAGDLTAETFAQALCGLRRFRGRTHAAAVAWLFGIAQNLLRQYYRHARVETAARRRVGMPLEYAVVPDYDEIEERMAIDALRPELAEAVATLSPEQRDALELRVVQELSYQEVAARLDCSEPAARMRVTRALRNLHSRLKGATL